MSTAAKPAYTPTEMMTIVASRALKSSDVCFVGIGAPSAACNLARLTHAPDITLIYESGTIATKPNVLPLSIGDGELCETALTTVPVVEMFRYWLQGGRISIGFLGGAHPSYAQGYYKRDNAYYEAWDEIARDRDSFKVWIAENVMSKGPEAFAVHARGPAEGRGK